MRKILLIDDDQELCAMLLKYLAREGFAVESESNGEAGLRRALAHPYELIILDVMLPGLSGFDLLTKLRQRSTAPVLMLTGRGEDIDRIVGLEAGADDYLAKPFNSRELVARMRAVLRRARARVESEAEPGGAVLRVGDVELNPGTRAVRKSGKLIELTTGEFEVLALLMASAGRIVSREHIAKAAFDRPLAVFDRSVDMHVSKLRRKLGSLPDGAPRITTVRNEGYLYALARTE